MNSRINFCQNNLLKFEEMKENKEKLENKPGVDLKRLVFDMIEKLPERSRDIIMKRFNLGGYGEAKTLEKIGEEYKITRERVRQIESEAISRLKDAGEKYNINQIFESIRSNIENYGGIASEKKITSFLFGSEKGDHKINKQITLFILSLDDRIKETGETRIHKKIYFYEEKNIEKFKNVIKGVEKYLEEKEKSVDFNKILKVASEYRKDKKTFPLSHLESYLDENKIILKNVLGEWGHTKWAYINPKNVRDKAYLTLKKSEKPIHFVEITDKINILWRNGRKANNQTVHNELIKDDRFVLVGRGIYALKEWGYNPGTVLDIIVEILKENGGEVKQDDIMREVLRKRQVRKNTIILNLQNREYFEKAEGKTYKLK